MPQNQPLQSSAPILIRSRSRVRGCSYAALERILRIHARLGNEQQVTAQSIACEFEVDIRTIKRDIQFMRDRFGLSIVWDRRSRSYYCEHHHPLLPLLRIDAEEALALALAGKTFAAWSGSALGQALTAALEKIAPVIGGAVSLPFDEVKRFVLAPDDPAAAAEHRHFAHLLEAIHRRRELRIVYQKPKARTAPETRILHPLHLALLEHRWLLIAYDPSRRALRNFVLARIRETHSTGALFEPPANFDRDRYLAGSLGRFVGDRDHHVRLLIDAEVAPYLREQPWHPSQTIAERPDGSIEVTLRVNHLNDLERRILACGVHVEVLGPEELRSRLRATAATLHARYGADRAVLPASEK